MVDRNIPDFGIAIKALHDLKKQVSVTLEAIDSFESVYGQWKVVQNSGLVPSINVSASLKVLDMVVDGIMMQAEICDGKFSLNTKKDWIIDAAVCPQVPEGVLGFALALAPNG